MNQIRPLREVFDQAVAGSEPGLDAAELASLDPELVAEALVGYADTAPIEVAEHLEPFVTAVTGHAPPEVATGLELLASVPASQGGVLDEALLPTGPAEASPADQPDQPDQPDDLGFGTGTSEIPLPDAVPDPASYVATGEPDPDPTEVVAPATEDGTGADWLDLPQLADPAPEDDASPDATPGE